MKKLRTLPLIAIGLFVTISVALAQTSQQSSASNWFGEDSILNNPDRPYLFYPDASSDGKKLENYVPQTPQEAQTALESLQESVKLSRALAIMNPTKENLKDYVTKQEIVLSKSSMFTDQWRRMLWENPQLDYSLTHRPTDNTAIKAYDQAKQDKTQQIIQNIAESQGLVFFVRGDCQYCHAFAPILKQFQQTYGLRIMTVSLDGGSVEGFEALPDNGIASKLGVDTTPALFLADTRSKKYVPVGFGVMSISELERRFFALATAPGEDF